MLKATWRRLGSPAWLAIGLIVLVPTLASAQLFPNRTIRRERPPCASEPPFNAMVRRDYFGYYPTCWTRFPAGWACPCPNPELPDPARSYKENPLGSQRRRPAPGDENLDDPGMDAPPNDEMRGNPPRDNPNLPVPNQGRSPFELDPNPKPLGTPPGGDPFEGPNPPNPRTKPNPTGPAGRPSGSTGLLEMPRLPETTPTTTNGSPPPAGSIAMAPDATLTSSDADDALPDLGRLPTAPTPALSVPTTSAAAYNQPAFGTPSPAQAPRRKGFLSSLFGPKNTTNR